MKGMFRTGLILLAAAAAACAPRERTLVLLSTNDMHAKIQNFPRLACGRRERAATPPGWWCWSMPATAGPGTPMWTWPPTPGMPMIALMNRLGYDVATLGNHEFDHGQAFLGRMIDSMDVRGGLRQRGERHLHLPAAAALRRSSTGTASASGFVGVVTNYEGPGHPAGNASSFAGLEFPDPQAMALKYAAELRPEGAIVLVLVSHMGDDRDAELLAKGQPQYDVVIGGHTHERGRYARRAARS